MRSAVSYDAHPVSRPGLCGTRLGPARRRPLAKIIWQQVLNTRPWVVSALLYSLLFYLLSHITWTRPRPEVDTFDLRVTLRDEAAPVEVRKEQPRALFDDQTEVDVALPLLEDLVELPSTELARSPLGPDLSVLAVSSSSLHSLSAIVSAAGGAGESDTRFASRKGRVSQSGTGHRVVFFGGEVVANSLVYVLDKSGSMRGERLTLAKQELLKSVEALNFKVRFNIMFFAGGEFEQMSEWMIPACISNKRTARAFVGGIAASGRTNPVPALRAAYRLRPDVIFLLSDGQVPEGTYGYVRVRSKARASKPPRVYTIGFKERTGENILMRIAHVSKGKYRFVE